MVVVLDSEIQHHSDCRRLDTVGVLASMGRITLLAGAESSGLGVLARMGKMLDVESSDLVVLGVWVVLARMGMMLDFENSSLGVPGAPARMSGIPRGLARMGKVVLLLVGADASGLGVRGTIRLLVEGEWTLGTCDRRRRYHSRVASGLQGAGIAC